MMKRLVPSLVMLACMMGLALGQEVDRHGDDEKVAGAIGVTCCAFWIIFVLGIIGLKIFIWTTTAAS